MYYQQNIYFWLIGFIGEIGCQDSVLDLVDWTFNCFSSWINELSSQFRL